jgi:hypothetical protein
MVNKSVAPVVPIVGVERGLVLVGVLIWLVSPNPPGDKMFRVKLAPREGSDMVESRGWPSADDKAADAAEARVRGLSPEADVRASCLSRKFLAMSKVASLHSRCSEGCSVEDTL